ncbi:MAG: SAM-dependent chlorinase/fluorinase [Deltaproteobacteria bacterium]|nr:SAM-dependent chlorinase/fluorinase [Deltaproteobacteria bacterium]
MRHGIVTLLSDFGTADAYVAAMRGVMLGVNRALRLVDITHEVVPQDVFGGALVLRHAAPFFPRGTVHLAVVDPGVGGPRAPIVIETALGWFVGPNNGILTLAAPAPRRAYRLENPAFRRPVLSDTFHGRDLFAPAAAYLACGAPAAAMGPALDEAQVVQLDLPAVRREAGALRGEVIHVDHFGNLITNVFGDYVAEPRPAECCVEVGGARICGVRRGYYEVTAGELCAVVGSAGLLEVAVRDGSATARLGLGRGAEVRVTPGRGGDA